MPRQYKDPEEAYGFIPDNEPLPELQTVEGLVVIPIKHLPRHIRDACEVPGDERASFLLGFEDDQAVDRFEAWLQALPLRDDKPLELFVLDRPKMEMSPSNLELKIGIRSEVEIPLDRPIALLVRDFGVLQLSDQLRLRNLAGGDGVGETALAAGSILIATIVKGRLGWFHPGFSSRKGNECFFVSEI